MSKPVMLGRALTEILCLIKMKAFAVLQHLQKGGGICSQAEGRTSMGTVHIELNV